jgi:hypothetical protein
VFSYTHWDLDYAKAARECGVELSLCDAVAVVNEWIERIHAAEQL